MFRLFTQIVPAMVCLVTILPAQSPAQTRDAAADAPGRAWKARAEVAAKRLAAGGLDKCDRAVELAFQRPNEVTADRQRSFELLIEIDSQAMVASYSYAGQRLTSFVLLALPPGWLAVQKTDSRNLNLLVTGSGCSFDLCTIDPFSTGACVEQAAR